MGKKGNNYGKFSCFEENCELIRKQWFLKENFWDKWKETGNTSRKWWSFEENDNSFKENCENNTLVISLLIYVNEKRMRETNRN